MPELTETPTTDTATCVTCGATLTRYVCTYRMGAAYDQWYAPGESADHLDTCEHEIA